jgi:hypothetical protein
MEHTTRMGAVSTCAINVWLYKSLPYDPLKAFAPVSVVTSVPKMPR